VLEALLSGVGAPKLLTQVEVCVCVRERDRESECVCMGVGVRKYMNESCHTLA